MQNILVALGFIDKNEHTEIISYIGPEFRILDEKKRRDNKRIGELISKEDAFFSLPEGEKPEELTNADSKTLVPKSIEYFHPLNFAILKGKNW